MDFIVAKVNTDGMLSDTAFRSVYLAEVKGKQRVVFLVHGWMESNSNASEMYRKGIDGVAPFIADDAPTSIIGVEWPSVLSQGEFSPLNLFDPLTFYSFEHRADVVGANALSTLIQSAMEQAGGQPIEFVIAGHSFGCKVACKGVCGVTDGTQNVTFKLILIEPAFQNDAMDQGGDYDRLIEMPVEIHATTSSGDTALERCFPAAESMNWFQSDKDRLAFGFAGPTQSTIISFGSRLVMRDLAPEQIQQQEFSLDRHSQIFGLTEFNRWMADFIQRKAS